MYLVVNKRNSKPVTDKDSDKTLILGNNCDNDTVQICHEFELIATPGPMQTPITNEATVDMILNSYEIVTTPNSETLPFL